MKDIKLRAVQGINERHTNFYMTPSIHPELKESYVGSMGTWEDVHETHVSFTDYTPEFPQMPQSIFPSETMAKNALETWAQILHIYAELDSLHDK